MMETHNTPNPFDALVIDLSKVNWAELKRLVNEPWIEPPTIPLSAYGIEDGIEENS